MSGFRPNPSDRQRRPLLDIQPARAGLPSSSSVASGTTSSKASSSKASSSSSSLVSGGSHLPSRGPSPAALGPGYAAAVSRPPREQLTRVACGTCRRRRTKCSGDRPKCAACVRNRSECTYQSLSPAETNSQVLKRRLREMEAENNIFKELYQHLNTGPESQAHEIVRRMRMGLDMDSIVRQSQDGDLLLQVSSGIITI